jgi:hypothetical protein
MAENKTKETEASVEEFIAALASAQQQADSRELLKIFEKASGYPPKMWGPSIIGFGSYHYKYASGHEGDAPLAGFSPRKGSISLYMSCDVDGQHADLLSKLGKHKAAKSCVYINKLADADPEIIGQMVKASIKETLALYPQP